ncbi:A-kinase anchor protein 9 [Chelonia mydas]|uniref:A-kinase anchor protein 9 n=1 Tax=Chelonia mydas TaxID=8469 RepID=M7BDQ6_CHEMY|nr:A-kinase anchor protein 9 [Chelonia mydas]
MRTLRSREMIKHDQTYTIEPDSEISTTADDYSSEEEEFGVGETYSEHEMQHSQTRLEMMENELAGKQQEIEELNRELEEMRAAYGTEGLQQSWALSQAAASLWPLSSEGSIAELQEFEAAIKQRDDIITQLTTNLQQARKEKDETLREFLELTEQSQKLQIQFQHLQASEALRNTSHSSTAADLLQAKQQILTHQQQLEEQEYLLKNYQKKNKEFEVQITLLQDRITVYEMEKHKNEREDSNKKLQEKEVLIGELKAKIIEEEKNAFQVKEKLSDANKSLEELKEQIVQKNQEANNVRLQLANCKQKERQCSDEIKQLMGTVEELQKRCHKDSQFEIDIVQRMELETQRRLAQLQAELDEMYGQQIVQMKQELIKQHALEIEELLAQQKIELEKILNPCSSDNISEDQVHLMNIAINELNKKLQDANYEKEKIKQDLSKQLEDISAEKSLQQTQIKGLFQELTFAREQIQRAKQTIMDKECRLNEADKYQVMIEELKAQLASASELRKELELKHEAEVTNYKIKLEMLEREKDEVLDRMAESQEAELERLRTQLLFSHEEELSNLREDLQQEHRINSEILKDNLATHYKQQLEGVQNEMSQKIEAMQFEKDNLITKQSQLLLEISKLKDLQQSVVNSKSEEMTLQIQELQKEIDVLRQEEKEEGILEQEFQELQLKTELLEKQMKEKEVSLQEKCKELETQNNLLKDENRALEEKLKHILVSSEEKLIFTDIVYSKSEDLDMQKRIEKLMAENEQFIKQDIELKAEIERQKNTFSFAEKNFEASYQELQEEYACLLKIKADLEESKNKEEAEYKTKLKALTEELQHLQSYELVVLKTKSSVFEGSKEDKICRAETFEVGEVVEKDSTELMEKLETTDRLAGETSLLAITQHENDQLQQQLDILKSEQTDLRLQMEAQRICLSLVYSAHVDQVREYLKAEKENALCSLKEELICSHAQEMNEVKKMYQLELQTVKGQQADDEGKSTVMLIEKLSRAVSEECLRLTQLLCSVQSEQHSTPIKVSPGEQDIFHVPTVERKEPDIELPTYRIQAQALQESMQILLNKIMEEYNRLMALHTQFMRDCKKVEEQQTSYVELEHRKEEESNCLQMKIEDFQTPSQDLIDLMVRASHWEEMENLKTQLEGQHAQEIEHLRSYFQQQLKETEERYTTEIAHLQNRLQDVSESPEDFSISEESQGNSKDFMQKMTKTESLYQQSTDTAVEFPSKMESKGDMDIIQLLEKQYQGRLEEEIAKVIVSMSVAFAQQTELARMVRQEEESALLVAQTKIVHKKEECFESRKKCTEDELDNHLIKEKKADIKHAEEFKSLSKELSEESSEISSLEEQLESRVKPGYILELSKNEMRFPVKVVKEISPYHEMATSSTETSSQLLLYEERLEDMRQELVRQYQEHQQATELLRQGHMQQMEWQKENQEQLLAELDRLKVQLAESVSVENDNLVTERERMLLEELELLKQHSVPGREKLHYELINSSTQTQNENESQTESKEYTFEGEDRGGKPEGISSDILSKERHTLERANNRLLKILLEVVKTTVAIEETIGLHVLGLLDRPGKDPPSSKTVLWEAEAEQSVKPCVHVGFEKEEPSSLYHGTDLGDDATIRWAGVTDEGLQLTQHLTGSGFAGEEIDPDNEELVLNISSRLQAAVEKLLEAINETSNQLEHAKVSQTELMRESFKKQQEATEFVKCQEELQERLNEEVKAREQLALELSKAEGLIDGYADERAFLEKQIQEKTDITDHLEQELLCTGNKLQELEAERRQIQEEKELLSRQKDAMKADAGPVEQRIVDAAVDAASQAELLEETEKLMKEKIEVQRQAEKEYDDLQKQVKALETDVEEQVNRFIELEQEKNAELTDLRQQNQALEKQLEKTRKFLDEQAIDREHERDVFQQEIQKLEQQLKTPQRFQPINEHQTREVEQLTNHLQEKTDKCSELLLSKEQLQRDIQERNEEIEKLECRIRELEQALIISADNLQKVEERKRCGAATVKGELPLEVQLQAEQEAVDRKEKEDEMERLGLVIQKSEDASIKDHCLVPGKLAQIMHEKEQEIDHLNEQITTLQQQLEITTDNKEDADSLKHELDTVLAEKEALKKQVEDNNLESSMTKNELEETKLKMNHLKKELDILKREHERVTEKYKHLLMKSDKAEVGDRSKDRSEKLEEALNEKSPELLENKIQLKSVEENSKITISNMEIKLQQLQAAIKERESELWQCYNQIKDLKEQSKVETEILKKKILELEEILQEKVAAALVSQVQLNAIQEQNKLSPRIQAFSKGAEEANKNTQTENVNHIAKEETESKLTEKLSEMENQLAKVYNNLELEKKNAQVAQKEAIKKENRLLELQQLLEDIQEKHKEEIKKTPKQGEVQTSEVVTELTQSQEGSVFIAESELEKIKAESAAVKEELSSYREKSEKLQEELMVRETSMRHLQEELHRVKDNLVEAEKKLADYMREEEEIGELESRKDVDKPDNVSTKEDLTSTRKSSSSQTEKTMQINSSNQTLQVLVKNAEIQNDLQNEYSSEEVAEVIREFTEKIDQMQELHAAEIMDMETRHISESEALKREQFVAVQVLTEECNALKEVIETLRANEAVPISGLPHTASYMARDGCSSDSSSDWSQGIYLAQSQGSDIVSEGVGEEDETSTDLLPKKIKGLLRAVHREGVQVLSLTEFPDSERDIPSLKQGPESWLEERKTFLSTVSSLKDLITQMQLHRETEICANCEPPESVPDWRGELLNAIQQVFLREQDVLLAASQTELSELGTKDAVVLMNQLEHRLQEQVISQRMAMDFIQNADRRSLLMEIQVLRTQMNNRKVNPKREQEIDPKSQEMLEYNMQQKQSQILEMQVELHSVKDRAAELQEQLNSERMMVSEVKNELAQAKLELETTLKAQHKHFKDLETISLWLFDKNNNPKGSLCIFVRTEVKEKAAELDMLKDTMANEQKKSRELQWALEKEKAKMERDEERGREEFEDLKISLEDQKQKNLQLHKLLEQEKQLSGDLQQKIESQEVLNAAQLSHERGRNSELQVLLESEKVRALEMSSALEREKELCAQLQSVEDKGQDGTPKPTEELLKDLQKQMDEKHDRIVELVSEMERYKLESVQMRQQMEKERQIQRKSLQTEQDANVLAQKKVHELESKVEDLHWQLEEKRQQVHKLEHEIKKLQEIIQELQKKEQEREEKKEAERAICQNLNETTWDTSNERTRNWVLQQKMEGAEMNDSTYPALTEMKGEADLNEGSKVLENIRQKLQNVSSKLKQLAHKAASRLQFETADDDNFIGVQSNIEDVLLLLGTLPGLSQLEGLKLVLPPVAPASSLTEKLLRQNAELTGLVSRLSEEKNNLRNAALKLEEELRRYRQRGLCGDYSSRHSLDNGANIDTLIASEREIWNREKLSLQKSLKHADAELSKLRAELRSEAFLRELGSNSENAVLKMIYGKYLRAESFRKALIYQKKYLLLLVGGFQECEEATLALIARMGGQPSYTDLEIITHRSKSFTRFRSVVRVSIAISRMKFLVRRWHRVTGSNLINVNRDGFSQNTGHELRSDSLAGGLELYGEQRHSSDRSRSELESLRSPINSQHRFQGIHVDLSPASLACSQLQNYDPDRALTDYINRLEALQRRLGSVQSGKILKLSSSWYKDTEYLF